MRWPEIGSFRSHMLCPGAKLGLAIECFLGFSECEMSAFDPKRTFAGEHTNATRKRDKHKMFCDRVVSQIGRSLRRAPYSKLWIARSVATFQGAGVLPIDPNP